MTNREFDSILKRIGNAKKKAKDIISNPNSTEDEIDDAEILSDSVDDLINCMFEYTDHVFMMGVNGRYHTNELDSSDYKSEIIKIINKAEDDRTLKHYTIITAIKVADKVCREVGLPEIYGELPEKYQEDTGALKDKSNEEALKVRNKIKGWTFNFCLNATIGVTLGRDCLDYSDFDVEQDYKAFQEDAEDYFKSKQQGKKILKRLIDIETDR